MKVGEICNHKVITVKKTATALDAALLMRRFHVGDVIIVGDDQAARCPVGIVTDRDLALQIIALRINPETVAVGDLAGNSRLLAARVDDDVDDALEVMRNEGVRRMPVLEEDGTLAGIISVDEILENIVEELAHLVGLGKHHLVHDW